MKKILKAGMVAVLAGLIVAGSAFADEPKCDWSSQTTYPTLMFAPEGTANEKYTKHEGFPANCGTAALRPMTSEEYELAGRSDNKTGVVTYNVWGKSASACASAGVATSDSSICSERHLTLNSIVQTIINTIIYVIGIIAVIMIILGGISYATSQGDAAKVKKGKDTILYGIVGLVIAILAYAIVNFVLEMMGN